MKMRTVLRGLSIAVAFAGSLLCAHSAFAQGCALCYNDAAATGPQAQAALRHGILALAIPPMLIFAAVFGTLYRRRNLHHDAVRPTATPSSPRPVSEIVLHLN
ncbi:MAG: hypothetical protein WAN10_18640 [Candidatus Acidiferrales bacterium]